MLLKFRQQQQDGNFRRRRQPESDARLASSRPPHPALAIRTSNSEMSSVCVKMYESSTY